MIPVIIFLIAIAVTWYAGQSLVSAVQSANRGGTDAPSLIFGSVLLFVGGGLALFLGLGIHQPSLNHLWFVWVVWAAVVYGIARLVVGYQHTRIGYASRRTRDDVDGRVIAAGAVALVVALVAVAIAIPVIG